MNISSKHPDANPLKTEYVLIVASMVAFVASLDFAYKAMRENVPYWHWSQLAIERLPTAAYDHGLFLICATAITLTTLVYSNTIGGFCRHICFMFLAVPMLYVYATDQAPREMFILATINIVLFNVLTWPARRKLFGRQPNIEFNKFWLLVVPFGLILFTIVNGGLQNSTFNILNIYETRRAASATQPLPIIYAILNVGAFVIPFATAVALHLRRYKAFFLIIVLSILLFFFYGHKTHLISFAFVTVMYAALMLQRFLLVIYGSLSLLLVLVVWSYNIPELGNYPSLYSTGRVFIIPARLNYFWYDFFHQYGHIYWADSKISLGLVERFFETTGPRLIADTYSGIDYSLRAAGFANANTGWLGAGYGQAGALGIFIYTLLNVGFVYFMQSSAKIFGSVIATAGLSVILWKLLTSVDFVSAIFSHGVLVAVLFVTITTLATVSGPSKIPNQQPDLSPGRA